MGKMGSWYSLITRQYSPCWLFGSPSAQSNQLTVSFLEKILKFNGISDLKKEVLTWKWLNVKIRQLFKTLPCEARSTLLERDRCAVLQSRLQARTAPSSRASSRPAPSTSASSWYLDINSHIEWHLFLFWHLSWHLSWQGRTIYDSVKVWPDPDKGDGEILTLLYPDGLAPPPRLQGQHREYQRRPWWRRTTRWSWSTCSQTCPPPSPSRRGSCRCPGPRLNTRGREPARASYSVRGSEIPELETCSDRIYLYFYRDPVIEIIEDKLSSPYVQIRLYNSKLNFLWQNIYYRRESFRKIMHFIYQYIFFHYYNYDLY